MIIPVVVLIISMYLVVGPIIDKPTIEYLYAAMFILGGMVFYVPFVHYGLHLKFMGKISVMHDVMLYVNGSLLGIKTITYGHLLTYYLLLHLILMYPT